VTSVFDTIQKLCLFFARASQSSSRGFPNFCCPATHQKVASPYFIEPDWGKAIDLLRLTHYHRRWHFCLALSAFIQSLAKRVDQKVHLRLFSNEGQSQLDSVSAIANIKPFLPHRHRDFIRATGRFPRIVSQT